MEPAPDFASALAPGIPPDSDPARLLPYRWSPDRRVSLPVARSAQTAGKMGGAPPDTRRAGAQRYASATACGGVRLALRHWQWLLLGAIQQAKVVQRDVRYGVGGEVVCLAVVCLSLAQAGELLVVELGVEATLFE